MPCKSDGLSPHPGRDPKRCPLTSVHGTSVPALTHTHQSHTHTKANPLSSEKIENDSRPPPPTMCLHDFSSGSHCFWECYLPILMAAQLSSCCLYWLVWCGVNLTQTRFIRKEGGNAFMRSSSKAFSPLVISGGGVGHSRCCHPWAGGASMRHPSMASASAPELQPCLRSCSDFFQ